MSERPLPKFVSTVAPKPAPVIATTPQQLVEAFLQGRSKETLRAYQGDLDDFRAFLQVETLAAAAGTLLVAGQGGANALMLSYRNDMRARELAVATTNRRLAALRSLVKLARLLGLVSWSLDVENLKLEPYRDTRGPGKEGVKELLGVLKFRMDDKACRDRAIVHLLYDLALRTHEVCGLDVEHVDLKASALWVKGKGRTERQRLTLPLQTREALQAWMKVRGDDEGALFVSLDSVNAGARLSPTSVYRVIRDLGEQAGVKARPHGLRHAAITEALDATRGDVRAVQRFSRHKDVRVLFAYDDARQDLAGEVARLVAQST